MKPASAEFYAGLAAELTTLTRLYRITPHGMSTVYLTDSDVDIEFNGNTYQANSKIECSAIENSIGGARTNFEIKLLFHGELSRTNAETGRLDGTTVEVDLIFYDHVEWGVMALATGTVAATSVPHKDIGILSCVGLVSRTQRKIGEQYSPTCRADFGDERCGIALGDHDAAFTVTAVTSLTEFTVSGLGAFADGHFDLGHVEWLTGDNEQVNVEVRSSTQAGLVKLLVRTPLPIQVGDTGNIVRGCDKTLAACTAYGNILNFRGEPYMPGSDFVTTSPSTSAPQGDAALKPFPPLPDTWEPGVL